MALLEADEIMRLDVKITPPELVGAVANGTLRVIPIVGGVFNGERLRVSVATGGADWNTAQPNGIAHVFAKYWLLTDDGELRLKTKAWSILMALP
jgi:hypothetical protein